MDFWIDEAVQTNETGSQIDGKVDVGTQSPEAGEKVLSKLTGQWWNDKQEQQRERAQANLRVLVTQDFGTLSREETRQLSTEQLGWFSKGQFEGFTPEQIGWLSKDQISGFSREQLDWLSKQQIGGWRRSRARSADVTTTARAPSVSRQQSNLRSGSEIIREAW